jgi:hypothetical protein
MRPIRSDGRAWLRSVVITAAPVVLVASVSVVVASRYRTRPVYLIGAVVQQNEDPRKQTPVTDVQVAVADGQDSANTKTDISGYFKLKMKSGWRPGQIVTLEFRNPKYKPLDMKTVVGDEPYVVRMVPLERAEETVPDRPAIKVTNVLVRYSTETTGELNVGSEVKTFQVPNKGDIPCNKQPPCSPDDKWKAAIGSESLDAGQGNIFENARVFCIAGPCPFTKIESDNFSRGGRQISVSVRNWSDTTTFMFQAEVFRQQVSDIIRETYPVIFGQTFNFSLPAAAEGPSLEAELDGAAITFPLGPTGAVSWAACDIMLGKNRSKSYRCEVKPGYAFP